MALFRLFKTNEFDEGFQGLDFSEQKRVEKILFQLTEKGDSVGKPLGGLSFFREKKFDGNRLYFLAYKKFLVVLAVTISDKKAQQGTINKILVNLEEYQRFVFERLKKEGII